MIGYLFQITISFTNIITVSRKETNNPPNKMGIMIEDHFERKARKEEILELQKNDDWKGVLDHFSRPGDKYHDPMLVWIRPSIEAIKFIESELKRSIQYQFYLFLL